MLLATSRYALRRNGVEHVHGFVEVPLAGLTAQNRMDLAVLGVISEGLVNKDDTLVCLHGQPSSGYLDTLKIIRVGADFELLFSLQDQLSKSDVEHDVLNAVLTTALELASEGREGKAVGAIFVLGDEGRVRSNVQQMIMNPFAGHAEEVRSVLDPSLHETLKEFSLLDGAIVIRGDGVVLSAGAYINTQGTDNVLSPGLGARHAAAGAITSVTDSFAVVVSESTGTVRIYKGGQEILTLKKD